jgi:hypothetical protein
LPLLGTGKTDYARVPHIDRDGLIAHRRQRAAARGWSSSPRHTGSTAIGWSRPPHQLGLREIAVPRDVFELDHLPLLGTGKTDYARVPEFAGQQLPAPPLDAAAEPALSLARG